LAETKGLRMPICIPRPEPDDYVEVLRAEIELVPLVDDFCAQLAAQLTNTRALAAAFGERHAGSRYADGKWSVREVIGHLSDCERVLSYRMLRFARCDAAVLTGFDANNYVRAGDFERRTLQSVTEEFGAVRSATIALIASLPAEAFTIRGQAGKNQITVAALAYLIAGHELHHQGLLRERYLPLIG
jgi:hypothetical protein